jgi:hypothetical protein
MLIRIKWITHPPIYYVKELTNMKLMFEYNLLSYLDCLQFCSLFRLKFQITLRISVQGRLGPLTGKWRARSVG